MLSIGQYSGWGRKMGGVLGGVNSKVNCIVVVVVVERSYLQGCRALCGDNRECTGLGDVDMW